MTKQHAAAKLEVVEPEEPEVEAAASPPEKVDDKPETVSIEFRDFEFKIPKMIDEWETEACLSMNQGNYILAAKILLGSAQWALLMSIGNKRKDIREFLTAFANVVDEECVS